MVDLLHPRPEQFALRDIANGLAHQERFVGQCLLHPTIAQHSLAVEYIARQLVHDDDAEGYGHSDYLALSRAALMHDAAEAYVGDMTGAVKLLMRVQSATSPFDQIEGRVQSAITERFDCAIPRMWEALIHEADCIACGFEMRHRDWCKDATVPGWLDQRRLLRYYTGSNRGRIDFLLRAQALGIR